MNELKFLERREVAWNRLAVLCDQADFRLAALSTAEIDEFIRLYRRCSDDLAWLRTHSDNGELIDYLNQVVARAYGILYRRPQPPLRTWPIIGLRNAAITVRRRSAFVFFAAFLFVLSALFALLSMQLRPDLRQAFIGPETSPLFESWKSGEFDQRTASEAVQMTAFYASNNPRAAILTGALGAATFGLGSVALIFVNGVLIGSLSSEMLSVGKLGFLISSIAPHGVPELTGLFISGGAGLLLGYALLFPGRQNRWQSLQSVGRDAAILLGTSVVLMFVAAPIEGFFSFNPAVPQEVKGVVALVSAVFWVWFWSRFGREDANPSRTGATS
jgi:uncharacterized membrane protein SpoIIM required for sporulation